MKHSRDVLQEEVVTLIPALRAFARTFYWSSADADDLVQETLVRALGNIEQFKQGTRMKSWLFTIMRNAFCTRFRLRERETPGSEECVSSQGSVPADQEWQPLCSSYGPAALSLSPNGDLIWDIRGA